MLKLYWKCLSKNTEEEETFGFNLNMSNSLGFVAQEVVSNFKKGTKYKNYLQII